VASTAAIPLCGIEGKYSAKSAEEIFGGGWVSLWNPSLSFAGVNDEDGATPSLWLGKESRDGWTARSDSQELAVSGLMIARFDPAWPAREIFVL